MSTTSEHRPHVAVIGAGIAGLAVAHRAVARGLRTTVLDRGAPGAATTGVAAGMLAPVSEAAFGERDLLALNLAAAARWPAWAAELASDSGRDPGLCECGTLLVARDRDQAEALERELAFRRDCGLPAERLLPSQARAREPALSPAVRLALDVPGDHAADPARLTAALVAAIERGGGTVRPDAEVVEIVVGESRVRGVRVAGGAVVEADDLVIAAGPWSDGLAGLPAEARVPVRPVKGQTVRLRDPAGPGLLRRVIRSEEMYLVSRGDGRYVLGATVEERGFDTAVTAGAVHDLLREAAELVPGVLELEIEELRAGLRPGTPDNAPVLGPGALPGLHWATGHYRHGILLAPVTGETVVAGILGEAPPPEAAACAASRFAPAREESREVAAVSGSPGGAA
ncbi:MAG TPA: glycine oxidase ThiO [Solirubrobacteraceae bacterium]|nr:glycine oxidase ThiO [Solirubrobacteraceae bacterium]